MGLFDKLFGSKKNSTVVSENNKVALSRYDKDGIYAIYDISLALSCLVTNAGDSFVNATLQDENEDKGWPSLMRISAISKGEELFIPKCCCGPGRNISYRSFGIPSFSI